MRVIALCLMELGLMFILSWLFHFAVAQGCAAGPSGGGRTVPGLSHLHLR